MIKKRKIKRSLSQSFVVEYHNRFSCPIYCRNEWIEGTGKCMWEKWKSSTRRGKLLWLAVGFLLGFFILPLISNTMFQQTNQEWMPLAGKVILLDPGHGGPDGGAVGPEGIVEKDIALNISLFLRDYLQEAGALVVMTREEDTDLASPDVKRLRKRKVEDLMKRVQMIHQKKVDAFISIHLNAVPSPRWSGAQTFYNPNREENKRLATFIQTELIRQLGNTERLAKQKGDIYILKQSKVPTVLVEVGFLSNPEEARLMSTKAYQQKIAASIYTGILRYYSGQRLPLPNEA